MVGIAIGFMCKPMEIQNVKPVDNGYYITINDEIYYSEVSND